MHRGIAPFANPAAESALEDDSRCEVIRCGVPEEFDFAHAVRAGLTDNPKHLPCRFLYDEEGSRLFEAICRLPEYYLTRAEEEIICRRARAIAARFGPELTVVDLGSGSSAKTCMLIGELFRQGKRVRYMPIDISPTALNAAARKLLNTYPELRITAVAGEYSQGLEILSKSVGEPKLVLWLGSNIGNLSRSEACDFLRLVQKTLRGGDCLLVGIDLHKSPAILESAYDDAAGVTARFSLNILARINRELGGTFVPGQFRHHAVYNEGESRIEISLVSDREQRVCISALDLNVSFDRGEPIHTEHSYKYSLAQIESLARMSGLRLEKQWLDSREYFSLNLLRASIQ